MPESSVRIIPPAWKPGDRWTVAMTTQAPVPAEMRPSYVEHIFEFRVDAVPDTRNPNYRIEVVSRDGEIGAAYAFYYRGDDFSLEKVTRSYPPSASEEAVLQNGDHPFIYYERRLPIVPDFFVAGPSNTSGRREFTVAGYRVIQEVLLTADRARITLERLEALGSLRVIMYWVAGDPWWSRIECTENPPSGDPFSSQMVASGHLVKGGAPVRK